MLPLEIYYWNEITLTYKIIYFRNLRSPWNAPIYMEYSEVKISKSGIYVSWINDMESSQMEKQAKMSITREIRIKENVNIQMRRRH